MDNEFEYVKMAFAAGKHQATEDFKKEATTGALLSKLMGAGKAFHGVGDPTARLALAAGLGIPMAALGLAAAAPAGVMSIPAALGIAGASGLGLYAGSRNPGFFGGSVKDRLLLEIGEQLKNPAKAGLLAAIPAAVGGAGVYGIMKDD